MPRARPAAASPIVGRRATAIVVALSAFLVAGHAAAQARTTYDGEGGRQDAAAESVTQANPGIYREALAHRGMKILVSTNERRLLLMVSRDTLMDVPVAVGMGTGFEFEGREYLFRTPTGRRQVLAKEPNPVWTPPDWHYKERALQLGLELVRMQNGRTYELEDGSHLEIRDRQVGRVNHYGNFWPFEPGTEIVFDGRIYMPPFGTVQRRVPDALGTFKLDMGSGYLIHGTHMFNEDSIGMAVSHGCVRMNNSDLDRLYFMVERGTPVFIY